MTRPSLELCRQALRAAVPALTRASPAEASAQHFRAWLALYQITEKQRWLDLLRDACSSARVRTIDPENYGEWLRLFCDGWVVDAAGPFRGAANDLSGLVVDGIQAVPGLLRNWRITGEGTFRDRALDQLPNRPGADFEAAAALHAAYHATGDEDLLDAARAPFTACSPADVPLRWWPLACDILDWDDEVLAGTVQTWGDKAPPAHDIIPALAPICLPRLDLEVRWWDARELDEGYVAEAVTFPYPALRLRFVRRGGPGQVLFAPFLAGEAREELEDAGVIASLLRHLMDEVDRQAVVNPPRGHLGRGTIRRR